MSSSGPRPSWSLLFVMAPLALGCGSSETSTPVALDVACADDAAAACLVNQQACSMSGSVASCAPCAEGEVTRTGASCEPIAGAATSHDFADFTIGAGEEVLSLCQSWTLGNATELWVNTVELVQDEVSHHSNWTFVPANQFEGPDGVWPCKDRGYSQTTAAISGGVLYAQSTQAKKEVQRFPEGVVVRIPPYARIIGDVHLLNTTAAPITGHARLNLYSIPEEDVKVKLAPFHLTFEVLDIPPLTTSRFEAECDLESAFQSATDGPVDMTVYFTLPHTHALATRMFFGPVGGEADGQMLLDVKGFNGEARGRVYEPPASVDGAKGFRFGCEFDNPRSEAVHWGFGDQEMCEMLGFADSKLGFEGAVNSLDAPTTKDGMPTYSGPCSLLSIPWNQDKPGGPPP